MSNATSRSGVAQKFGLSLNNHKQAFIDKDAAVDTLQVIAVGLPRCGTSSLKRALELLGFDPCHHMVDCIDYPDRSVIFTTLISTQDTTNNSTIADPARLAMLKSAMKGYKATVDAPTCDLFRELYLLYPDAKFILNTRDNPTVWWTSFTTTIGTSLTPTYRLLTLPVPFIRKQCTLIHAIVDKWTTQGGGYGPNKYLQHNQEVRETIPKEKLLEFNVKEGWAPLCKFLEVEVPGGEGFPHLNDTREILAAFWAAKCMGGCAWVVWLGVVVGVGWLAVAPPVFVRELFV